MSFRHLSSFLLVIQIFSRFACSKAAFICDPARDCENAQFGALVPDPNDCHNYYICIDSNGKPVPSDQSLTCPTNTSFDQTTAQCKPEAGTCNNDCNRICQAVCKLSGDFIQEPSDCNKYYICAGNPPAAFATTCTSEEPFFNGTGCSTNEYECCDACVPYCFEPATQVQDPNDCMKYYLCIAGMETPDENYHFTCEPGIFDKDTGVCDPDITKCTNYCNNVRHSRMEFELF